jgi:transposase
MSATIIGVDPHKRSHTAVVLDDGEQIASQLRVDAGPGQVDDLLAWAPDRERVWAIENVNGLGHLLAQQLSGRAEVVIDVPATLSSRARKLSGKSGRKSEHDARSVAIAAAHNKRLRRVTVENNSVVLGLLLDRRWHLVAQRQRTLCQLHALLNELVPAGAARHLTSKKAAVMLRRITPGGVVALERKLLARELLEDVRWLDKRIPVAKQRLSQALAAYSTTLTDIHGVGEIGAATILAIVDDPMRFPDRGHFAAFNGTAPLEASSGDVRRHRLSRRGNRQMNKVIHVAARTQIRRDGPGRTYYDRKLAECKSQMEALRALKRQLSEVIYRRLLADERARQAVRGGQTGDKPRAA